MPYKLLVVEDEQALGNAMAQHLRSRDFAVDLACSFDDANSMLRNTEYDLLLTDLHLASLPGVEGFMLVLETRTRHPNLPVIILTGYDSEEIQDWTLSYPRSAYMRKPASLRSLEGKVRDLLGQPA